MFDFFIGLLFFVSSFSFSEFIEIESCDNDDSFSIVCGFQNPEDLYLSPSQNKIIISEFGSLAPNTKYGELSFYDLVSESKGIPNFFYEENTWGDPKCKLKSRQLSPHGIDLIQRDDGRYMLAVVNHLPSESIELFELVENDSIELIWRGCIDAPENKYFNDVALKTDGSFYITHMYDLDSSQWAIAFASMIKNSTGEVYFWNVDEGFTSVPNTSGSFPNGIDLDVNEENLYINYWFSGKTIKFNLKSLSAEFEHIGGGKDNLLVTDSGLWVAAHDYSGLESLQCDYSIIQCPLPFTIHHLALDNLDVLGAYSFSKGQMGAATVGLPHKNKIWLGSFHGDRIASFEFK